MLVEAGASYTRLDESELPDVVAKILAEEKIVALFQGRMEFGPRALGCRSILASPLRAEMKDVINRRIKFRESFRPFAPVSPEHRAAEVFEHTGPLPYMLATCNVRPEMRVEGPRDHARGRHGPPADRPPRAQPALPRHHRGLRPPYRRARC